MRTNVQYAFIPKTHKGNLFVPECYAAKNPEVAKASNDDYDKLTSHWVEIGSKQGLDADCGPGTSTIEERIKMLEEQEQLRLKTEARKVACKAADKFWIASEERCDGFRDAEGNRNTEAEACRDNNNFWDDEFGFKFCNTKKDPSGQTKTGKEVCSSEGSFWDGSKCIRSRNVDGTPKNFDDICSQNNGFVQNATSKDYAYGYYDKDENGFVREGWKFCDVRKDSGGNPVTPEQICKDLNSQFKDGKCDIRLFPNGKPKPQEYIPFLPYPGQGDDYYDTVKIKQQLIMNERQNKPQEELREIQKAQGDKISKLQLKFQTEKVDSIVKSIDKVLRDALKVFDPVYFFKNNSREAQSAIGSRAEKLTESQKILLRYAWITNLYWRNYEGTPGIRLDPNLPVGTDVYGSLTPSNSAEGRKVKFMREVFNFVQNGSIVERGDPENKSQRDRMVNWMNNWEENGFGTLKPELWETIRTLLQMYDEDEKLQGSGKPGLTLYWAEWCPHCHDLMPEWKKLKHKGVKIEAIEESKSKVKVDGYPTIVFRSGKTMEKYTGPRTAKAIKKFLKNKLS